MDTPQELLDQIHATGIFALDARTLSTMTDRAERAKQIRRQLLQIRERARTAYKNAPQDNNRLAYQLLDSVTHDLEIALRAFVTDPDARIPRFGTVFFEQGGRWHIVSHSQADEWKRQRQAQQQAQKAESLETALNATRGKLKAAQRDLYRHDEAGRGIRLSVAGALLAILGFVLFAATQMTLILAITGIGALLLVIGIAIFIRWRTRQRRLQQRFDQLQTRGREQMRQQRALQERQQ